MPFVSRSLIAVALSVGLLALEACTIALDDPTGKACNEQHPCSEGTRCVDGLCVSAGGTGGGTAGGSAGGGNVGGGTAGGVSTGGGGAAGGGQVGGGDAGAPDAGDAGTDAGLDGGGDAGPTFIDGGIFYVDPVMGNDGNDGTTPASAWQTLTFVSSYGLAPGATVLLKGGALFDSTTNGKLFFQSRSGTADAPITFGTYGGDGGRAILEGGDTVVQLIFLSTVSYMRFFNLELRNAKSFAVYVSGSSHLVFDNLYVHHAFEGFHPSPAAASDDVLIRGATITDIASDGGQNAHAMTLLVNNRDWVVKDTDMARCEHSCVTDFGINTVFQNVTARECGYRNVSSDRFSMVLRGKNTRVSGAVAAGAWSDCLVIGFDGGTIEHADVSRCVGAGLNIQPYASGPIIVTRSVVSDTDAPVRMSSAAPLISELRFANDTFIGGRSDGGASLSGVSMRVSQQASFENNWVAGSYSAVSSHLVVTTDAPSFGFVERGNAYQLDGGPQFWWNGAAFTYAGFVGTSQVDGGSCVGTPAFAGPGDYRLTLGSSCLDRGVIDPATGALSPGCDGGVRTYCGSAPEPGAFELLP